MSSAREYTWDQIYLDEYVRGKSLVHGRKPDRFVVWAAKYLKEEGLSGAMILDAGCGEGRNSVYLAKQGFKTWGIDIASSAIEKGKRWVDSEGLMDVVNLSVGDVTKLPYGNYFFDAVIDSFAMEFIREREQYLEEVARVLKPEGLFFMRTHILPAKHGLDPETLKRTLEKDFEILRVQNPTSDTLDVVAERRC